jgi:signal transduction histidine kinase
MSGDLLLRRKEQPDLVNIGTRLRSAALRMAGLIDDVLDFARGRMGPGIGIVMAEVTDLSTALDDVMAEVRIAHPDRVLQDHIAIPQPVVVDRARIQQLLANLVNNAVSHGASDKPVGVDVRVEDDDLVLEVSNSGIPIAPADLAHVFEPYWRPRETKPGGGLGLGPYICGQIVKEHGGTLQVRSSLTEGTVFTARIPVRAARPAGLRAVENLPSVRQ